MSQTTVVSPYADYAFYTDVYLGNAISAEDFPRMEMRAEEQLDMMTFHRIKNLEYMNPTLETNIRKAVCAMAEACARSNPSYVDMPAGIRSESLDGYSVSFGARTASQIESDYEAVMRGAAEQYLGYSGLLYRGGGKWHDD